MNAAIRRSLVYAISLRYHHLCAVLYLRHDRNREDCQITRSGAALINCSAQVVSGNWLPFPDLSLSFGNLLGELSPVNAANLIAFGRASSPSLPDNVVYELVQNDLRMEGRPSLTIINELALVILLKTFNYSTLCCAGSARPWLAGKNRDRCKNPPSNEPK